MIHSTTMLHVIQSIQLYFLLYSCYIEDELHIVEQSRAYMDV
jgi:hypothetical protein